MKKRILIVDDEPDNSYMFRIGVRGQLSYDYMPKKSRFIRYVRYQLVKQMF